MAGEALIAFRTNIKEMVAEVKTGLDEMTALAVSKGQITPKQADLISDIQIKRLREAQQELAKLDKALARSNKSGTAPAETLTQGHQRIAAETRRKIAEDYAKHKIPVEFVANIDANLGPLTRSLHDAVRNAVASGVNEGLVGATRLRTRQDLNKVYEQTPQPQPRQKPANTAAPAAAGGGSGGGGGSRNGKSDGSGGNFTGGFANSGDKAAGASKAIQILDKQTAQLLDTFTDLGGGKFSRAVNGVRKFYEISSDAAEKAAGLGHEITRTGDAADRYKYYDALGRQARIDTAGNKKDDATRAADLAKSIYSPTGKDGLADDVRKLTGNLYEVQRQGVSRFVEVTSKGAEEVAEGGKTWHRAMEAAGKRLDAAYAFNNSVDSKVQSDLAKGLRERYNEVHAEALEENKARDRQAKSQADLSRAIDQRTSEVHGEAKREKTFRDKVEKGYDKWARSLDKNIPTAEYRDRSQNEDRARYRRDQAGRVAKDEAAAYKADQAFERNRNFERIFPEGPTGKPISSVKEIAPGLYKEDLQNGLKAYYKLVNGGLEDVGREAPGFARAARADYKRRDKGFLGGLTEGVFGDQDYESRSMESLGRSAGITAKYATLATVFYGIQNAAIQAGSEMLDFEDSLTDLKTAMEGVLPEGESFIDRLLGAGEPSQGFLTDLSDSAALAGANVGQAMDLAASAMRAFGDETDQSKEAMEQMGARFAAEASKIATLTKTDIKDAGGNLKAIALGFDVPTQNFSRVTDVLAGSRAVGGGDEKQVGQFLANIAVSAKEAGFAIEEVGALGSKVIAETDQGGQLVANRFSRLFSIIGGSAGKKAISDLNQSLSPDQQVDIGADVKTQIVQLSQVYDQLGKSQQQQLINSLGGTANARELLILLDNADALVKKVGDEDWSGKGAEQYKKTLYDMRGVLTRITGDLKAITTALAQSGLLDPFLALIQYGLLPALDATKDLLNAFNQIPHPLRSIALGLLGIYATMRLIEKLGKTEALGGFLAGARGRLTGNPVIGPARPIPGAGRTGVQLLRGDTSVSDVRAAAGRQATGIKDAIRDGFRDNKGTLRGVPGDLRRDIGAGRAALTGRAGLLASEIGPLALAIGGALAVNETFKAGFKINKALDNAQIAKGTRVESIGVEEFNDTAKNLRASASELRQASGGFFGSIVNFLRGNPTDEAADELEAQAAYNERQARRLKAFQDKQADPTQGVARLNVTGTAEEFQDSFDIMIAKGASATEQFRALVRALEDFNASSIDGSKRLSDLAKYNLQLASGDAARGFVDSLKLAAEQRLKDVPKTVQQRKGQSPADALINPPTVFDTNAAAKAAQADVARYAKLDPSLFSNQVETITKNFFAANPTTDITSQAGSKALNDALYSNLKATIPNDEDRRHAANTVVARLLAEAPKESVISPETLQKIVENAVPMAQAVGAEAAANADYYGSGSGKTQTSSYTSAKAAYETIKKDRELLYAARERNRKLDTSTTAGRIEAMEFNRKNPQASFDKLDREERAAYVAMQDAKVENMRTEFETLQASKPKEDAAGRIKDLITEIDKELAEPHISQDKKLQLQKERAEAVVQQNQQAQLDAMAASRAKFSVFDEVGQATSDRRDAERILKENFTDKGITSGSAYEQAKADVDRKKLAEAQAKTRRRQAKRDQNAFSDSSLDTAQRGLKNAEDELKDLEKYAKGSTEYYEKLKEVNQKRREVEEENVKLAKLNAQNKSDLTDPVQQAQIELNAAKDKLARDKKNKEPKDVITQDEIDVKNATARQDSELFSQRLNDVQHAHDMGRISNQAFLEYMTSERNRLRIRLAGMKKTDNGYRQTVEQLQQLDSSIKSAADTMSGMFNIGNIDIPTPYQVRRALETKSPGDILGDNSSLSTGGNVTNDTSTKQVILNGVPIQQVLAIIEDLFGKKARASAKRRAA